MVNHIKQLQKNLTEAKSPVQKATAMLELGNVLLSTDLEKTLQLATDAGKLAEEIGDQSLQALSLKLQGLYYSINSNASSAMEYYTEAVNMYTAINDNCGLAAVIMNMGTVKLTQAEYIAAMEYYQQALALYLAEDNNAGGLAKCYNNMGVVFELTAEYTKALEMFELSIPYYNAAGLSKEAANAEGNIALVYKSQGLNEKALEKLMHCLEQYSGDFNKIKYITALINIGDTYLDMDNTTTALEYFQKALHEAKAINHRRYTASSHSGIGKVFCKLKGTTEARINFTRAQEIYTEINEPDGICDVYYALGECEMHEAQYEKARENFETALQIAADHHLQHHYEATVKVLRIVYERLGIPHHGTVLASKQLATS